MIADRGRRSVLVLSFLVRSNRDFTARSANVNGLPFASSAPGEWGASHWDRLDAISTIPVGL
jgi:hypothetical protein